MDPYFIALVVVTIFLSLVIGIRSSVNAKRGVDGSKKEVISSVLVFIAVVLLWLAYFIFF